MMAAVIRAICRHSILSGGPIKFCSRNPGQEISQPHQTRVAESPEMLRDSHCEFASREQLLD